VLAVLTALVLTLAVSACGATRGDDNKDIAMWIPNSAGGGYDQTGRAAVSVMEQEDISGGNFEVTNILGAGGSVAMTRLMGAEGDEHTMMTVGLGVVGSLYSFGLQDRVHDATPLASSSRTRRASWYPRTRRTGRSTTSSPPGRPTRTRSRSVAAPRRAAPTTSSRCSWPRPWGSTPRTSSTSRTTAAVR